MTDIPGNILREREVYLDRLKSFDLPPDFLERVIRERIPANLQILASFHRSLVNFLDESGYLSHLGGRNDPALNALIREIFEEMTVGADVRSFATLEPAKLWQGYFLPQKGWILRMLKLGLKNLFELKMERGRVDTVTDILTRYQELQGRQVDVLRDAIRTEVSAAFEGQLTALKMQSDEFQALARTDALTGLGSRRAFDEHIAQLASHPGKKYAILMIDADHFKLVNDTYGHATGDLVLSGIGALLNRLTREDTAYRYGGEEMAIPLEGALDEDLENRALLLAEGICAELRAVEFEAVDGRKFKLTASIGVAVGIDIFKALKGADAALYDAKNAGRDQVGLRR